MRFWIRTLVLLWMAGNAVADPPLVPLPPLTPAETQRIDAVVGNFPAAGAERGRVFFVGFAGYGEERVFAEEIKLAAREVGARFGSTPRTLLLINDRRDLASWPMASHENLRYALLAIGRVMDPQRDVLFLALSSHGARNGLIEVSNTILAPSGLSARRVGSWLAEAGIRSRVVIVSACFSGAFLGPLAGNDSIVITAARHDRSSFGCSDQRELTYFGEAFYRDSLPFTHDLRAAFEHARSEIRRREKQEGARPSQPQGSFGPLLESRLSALMSAPVAAQ